MAEVTNELIYEVLKSMQARLGNIEQGNKETAARLSALQTHLLAVEKDVANIYESLGALDARLDRIEKRMDLIAEPGQ